MALTVQLPQTFVLHHQGQPLLADLTGVLGFLYSVESSTDLTNWLPVTTNTLPLSFPF